MEAFQRRESDRIGYESLETRENTQTATMRGTKEALVDEANLPYWKLQSSLHKAQRCSLAVTESS